MNTRKATAGRRFASLCGIFCALIAFCAPGSVPAQAQVPVAPSGTAPGSATAVATGGAASFPSANQLYQRGRQLQLAGKEAEATKAFASSLALTQKLVAAEPGNLDYVSLHVWNLFRLGRHAEVVSLAQKTLVAARDYRIYETMGESLYFLDRNEDALEAFASYVELAPERDERMSSAYYFMGECLVRLKRYEHADIALSTATTMEKGMYYWWYRLGFVKELLGQYKKAYEAFGTSISLNAGFKPAQEARARVKAKAGL